VSRRDDDEVDATSDGLAGEGSPSHRPVLLSEVLDFLRPKPGGIYVDATLGGGSHTEALLQASAPSGRVVAFDRDRSALEAASGRLASFAPRLHLCWGSFADLDEHLDEIGIGRVDGILADLGLSSIQLDAPERGFTFQREGPLDMRFDRSRGPTAAELVNEMEERELARILREYGEERRAAGIARRIVERRPIRTTADLRRAVVSVLGPRRRGIDPATRTFQALRIAVNGELEALETFLGCAPERLEVGGRLVVVAYHSLEDRAVKWSFRDRAKRRVVDDRDDRDDRAEQPAFRILTKKPVTAQPSEVAANRRARSAKLRALERAA
jgi:16S rRNA (cytosine1402-N4)-methyltransferase